MKETRDWDEEYLLNLPSGEYDWIELKDSRKLDFSLPNATNQSDALNELSKQLSAFANSGGGTIVYGLEDVPPGKPHKVDSSGGVSLKLKNGTKEWLEDIIPNLTDHPLNKFNVYVLTNNQQPNSSIAQDKGIFLIEIPSSEQAPHQANDKKYYIRVGGKSRPAGHQLILDIIGRAKYPQMKLFCHASWKDNNLEKTTLLTFVCKNVGKIYANYVNGELRISNELLQPRKEYSIADQIVPLYRREPKRKTYNVIPIENMEADKIGGGGNVSSSKPYTIKRYKPILPNLSFSIPVQLSHSSYDLKVYFPDEKITWSLYADNAPIVFGEITISEILENKMSEF